MTLLTLTPSRTVLIASILLAAAPTLALAHGGKHAAPVASAHQYEIRFLKKMIDHHLSAIQMGEECGTRATHAELKDLCHNILSAQQSEVATMRDWLQRWYGIAYTGMPMTTASMRGMRGMQGDHYEIAFMQAMVQHHRMAVQMAKACLKRAEHAELKDTCQNIITSQQQEITTMESWLCQWYQKCKSGRTS